MDTFQIGVLFVSANFVCYIQFGRLHAHQIKINLKNVKSLPYPTSFLSFEWNSIRLGGPAHGIVTKTVHKTLPGVVGVKGVGGGRVGSGGVKGVGEW